MFFSEVGPKQTERLLLLRRSLSTNNNLWVSGHYLELESKLYILCTGKRSSFVTLFHRQPNFCDSSRSNPGGGIFAQIRDTDIEWIIALQDTEFRLSGLSSLQPPSPTQLCYGEQLNQRKRKNAPSWCIPVFGALLLTFEALLTSRGSVKDLKHPTDYAQLEKTRGQKDPRRRALSKHRMKQQSTRGEKQTRRL